VLPVYSGTSSHSGRLAFIVSLSEKAVSMRVIQELARHSSMNTPQRYIDVSLDKLRCTNEIIYL
jgi:integrase/recombinase XerD